MIITFQEFEKHEQDRAKWIGQAIAQYKRSDEYKIALEADLYEKQQNTRIKEVVKLVYALDGTATKDFTATNNQIASNFFHRLVTQRVSYSLGNGVSFASKSKEIKADQSVVFRDQTKDEMGNAFDDMLYRTGFYAVKHGVAYCFDNDGEYHVFPMTEFLPFKDEVTGKIRAGVRFWCLEWNKRPVVVDLYEEDGYSRYMTGKGKYGLGALELVEDKKPYKQTVQVSEADGEEVIGGDNFLVGGIITLPIAVMYGNKNKQSALVGMKANIDAYDMIHSGYCNDLSEVAQVYWVISNASGMDDSDLTRFRDRLLLQHVAVADTDQSKIEPFSQEIPYNSREACLNRIRDSIYSDFGALDVKNISASAVTATQIRAAYQSMDEEADDFEYQVNEFVQQLLALRGIEDYPLFDRNRISNELEETQMIMMAANYLDDETLLKKLPFVTVDEVDGILARKMANDQSFAEPEFEEV